MSASRFVTAIAVVFVTISQVERDQLAEAIHLDAAAFSAEWFVTNYGRDDDSIDIEGLAKILDDINKRMTSHASEPSNGGHNTCTANDWLRNKTCLQNKCLLASDIFALHSVTGHSVNASGLRRMSTTVLYAAISQSCAKTQPTRKSSQTEAWGYGFLSVTIINMCALGGLCVKPVMNTRYYQTILMYMVALAIGTLCGSALLILIPESFDMASSVYSEIYVWRLLLVIGGIYMFYLTERLMGNIMDSKKAKQKNSTSSNPEPELPTLPPCSLTLHTEAKTADHLTLPFEVPTNSTPMHHSPSTAKLNPNGDMTESSRTKPTSSKAMSDIKGLAWMVITGDGLHNFVDGLSVGAAFAQSPLSGVSVSVAVFCEELPHELGDFAVLLNSGMTIPQALGFNFLSACTCYIGLIIGIAVGETPEGSYWIFSIAAGMFLYIALVDMLPEVNKAAEEEVIKGENRWRAFLVQNAGLLTGWTTMLLLALYSRHIDFEK